MKQEGMEKSSSSSSSMSMSMMYGGGGDPKKKRLSTEQLESLENSFQEEIKLDPDRKMKLAKELGLQPRQIAVWFQNRRARWKGKQLERLYDALKQEFDAVSRDKHKLQQEVSIHPISIYLSIIIYFCFRDCFRCSLYNHYTAQLLFTLINSMSCNTSSSDINILLPI